jgi:hypothetical protein
MQPKISNFRASSCGADVLFLWREHLNFIFWQTISVTFGKITGKLTSYDKIRVKTVKNDRLQRIFLQILACERKLLSDISAPGGSPKN